MNKNTGLVMSVALLFTLTGCGTKKEDQVAQVRTEEVTVVEQENATATPEETTRDAKELMEQPTETQPATTEESAS